MNIPVSTALKESFFNGMSKNYRWKAARDVAYHDACEMLCERLEESLGKDFSLARPVCIKVRDRWYIVHAGGIVNLMEFPDSSGFTSLYEWVRGVFAIIDFVLRKGIEAGGFPVTALNDMAYELACLKEELEDWRTTSALLSRQCAAFCDGPENCQGCAWPCNDRKGRTPREWREINMAKDIDINTLNRFED